MYFTFKTELKMRDPASYAYWTKKNMKRNNLEPPKTVALTSTMMVWQSQPLFTSLTTSEFQIVDDILQEIAPKIFNVIQTWMNDDIMVTNNAIGDIAYWLKRCIKSESENETPETEDLHKRITNEILIQITKQISGNPSRYIPVVLCVSV